MLLTAFRRLPESADVAGRKRDPIAYAYSPKRNRASLKGGIIQLWRRSERFSNISGLRRFIRSLHLQIRLR